MDLAGLRYFITGSIAGMVYGEPRLTMDVDMVVVLPQSDIRKLVESFNQDEFYCPPREVISEELSRPEKGHFNLIHHDTGFKADVYLAGNDPLHEWAFSLRREIKLGENSIWIAPPEYVIVRKLQYYQEGRSEKHFRDIHAMIERSADEIDEPLLMRKIAELNLADVWSSFDAWRSW
ncbi:MAG: hypothetical protein R3F13_01850 [Prosthecobacter sp.]